MHLILVRLMAVKIGKGHSTRALDCFEDVSSLPSEHEPATKVSPGVRMETSPKISLVGYWCVS
jgi:hypothetical protein